MVDEIGLAQLLMFGFPIGGRTLTQGISFRSVLPQHLKHLVDLRVENRHQNSLSDALMSTVHQEEDTDCKASGVLMSGGYDSRLVLAALMKASANPTLITYNNRSSENEMTIVSNIAKSLGLEFIACRDESISDAEFDEIVDVYLENSCYLSSLVRIMYYQQLKRESISFPILYSGEGETFRFPGFPSEYISMNAYQVLLGREPRNMSVALFEDLPWREAFIEVLDQTSVWQKLSFSERIHKWLIEFAYPIIYGSMAMAFNQFGRVTFPLLKPVFVNSVASSGMAMQLHRFPFSVASAWRVKKKYASIIQSLSPELLEFNTDRGYPIRSDLSFMKYLNMNAQRKLKGKGEKTFSASAGARGYKDYLFRKLTSTGSVPHVNPVSLKETLASKDAWDGITIQQLSQVLTISRLYESH